MSRRRAIHAHLDTMGEIRGIMGAMKNLAFAEHRKLGRFLDAQGRVVRRIEEAAADLLSHYPQPVPDPAGLAPVWLVIGSERGFCGDFNDVLLRDLESRLAAPGPGPAPNVLAVGYKLAPRLADRPGVAAVLDGVGVAEEVDRVLGAVVGALRKLEGTHGSLAVTALHHEPEGETVVARALFPPFPPPPPPVGFPPLIHLAPEDLFARLVDQYLLAALNAVFLTSLLAENQQRMRHLEGAIRRLDDRRRELTLQANALRQEEITEEIEMILLNVEAGA